MNNHYGSWKQFDLWAKEEDNDDMPQNIQESKVTSKIIALLKHRDQLGWEKFGRALEDNPSNRLIDLQEELIDALQYITHIIMVIEDFKNGPNSPQRRDVYIKSLAKKLLESKIISD
jgi:hypothetical protein